MANEALLNVLSQIGQNYARAGEKDRERKEKLQDTADARDFSREQVATENTNTLGRLQKESDIKIAGLLQQYREAPAAQQDGLAATLGLNRADYANPQEFEIALEGKLADADARKQLATDLAKLNNAVNPAILAGQSKVLDAQASQNQIPAKAMYDQYQAVDQQIKSLASANGVSGPMTEGDLAAEKIHQWVAAKQDLPPAAIQAIFKNNLTAPTPPGKTTQQMLAAIQNDPTTYAKGLGLITDADVKAIASRQNMMLRGQNMEGAAMVAGLLKQQADLSNELIKARVNPTLPWEAQPVYGRGTPLWKEPAVAAAPASDSFWKTMASGGPFPHVTSAPPAVSPAPAAAPAAAGPAMAPAYSIQGLAQRLQANPQLMTDIGTLGAAPLIRGLGQGTGALVNGLWSGNYSASGGPLDQAGQAIGGAIAPDPYAPQPPANTQVAPRNPFFNPSNPGYPIDSR